LFALLALGMIAMTLILPRTGYVSSNASVTSNGMLLGFTLELPLYFWLLILRPKGTSPLYAVPIAAAGYLFCRLWTASATGSGWIPWAWIALAPLEALFLMVLTLRALRVVRNARTLPRANDLIERLLQAADREFPENRAMAAIMYELALIYYAFGGKPGVALTSRQMPFTYHRRSGLRFIYGVAVVFGCLEIVGIHLLLVALSPRVAWALTAFEFYGVVWVVGLLRSVDGLPIVLDEHGIHIRYGVMYSLFVPYEVIQDLQRGPLFSVDTKRKNYLNCAFMNAPDCVLRLRAATRARLPYSLSRNVDEIGLMLDEPREFIAQLERRISTSKGVAQT
jgi:hypothetical protein